MNPIPPHQLCTDCKTNQRALAQGVTGYASLCVDCFNTRRENAKKKKPLPTRVPGDHPYTPAQYEALYAKMGNDAELDNWEAL